MELSIKVITLFAAVILSGLSAGLFYAWQVSVIPGTKQIEDVTYLETMQSINRAILNPAFFIVFFGTLIALVGSSIYEFHSNKLVFGLIVLASVFYAAGTFGVTALGNVPLNNELEGLKLSDLSSERASAFRTYYESNWNRLHLIRTIFSLLSFLLTALTIFIQNK